jgi:signal transduction histidine kinase/HAMP domain-containing protein
VPRRIPFRYRVGLLVLLAAIALLTVTAVSLVLGNHSTENLSGIETRYVPLIELDRDLKTTFAQIWHTLEDAAAAGEEGKVHDADALRDELLRRLREGTRTIENNGGDPAALSVELALYYGPARELSLSIARGTPAGQLSAQIETMRRAQLAFASHLDAATAPKRERLAAAFESARASQRASLRIDIAVAAGALLVMALLSWWIIRTTVRSVHAVTEGVERLAAGTFDHEIVVESTDEIGDLASEANRTASRLREYREQIEQQHWISTGVAELADAIAGELEVDVLAKKALGYLVTYVGATAGTIHATDERGTQRLVASVGTLGVGAGGSETLKTTLPHGERVMGVLVLELPAPSARAGELVARVRTAIGIAFRVAESRHDTEELLRTTEAANRELEAFGYSVSHDLRRPLRAIDAFSRALVEDCAAQLPPEGHDHLRRITSGAQRMAELIDDLFALSKVTRGEFRREHVDLSAAATAIAGELARHEPERRAEISIAPGVFAEADPKLMKIVLENLLGNAWKFTSKLEVAKIAFGVADGVYFVRDNGAGFDMQYAKTLFAPFQRLHTDKEFAGTGIGLATVSRIIQRHGGRIWAEAAVGDGATFRFTLPEGRQVG